MNIQELFDFVRLDYILENWSQATGLTAAAFDTKGVAIAEEYGKPDAGFPTTDINLTVEGNIVGKITVGQTSDEPSEEAVSAAIQLLDYTISTAIDFASGKLNGNSLTDNIQTAANLIAEINDRSQAMDKIESKQRILSLNASIEAARAGEFGRGFAVVASEFGKLAVDSGEINKSIKDSIRKLTTVIDQLEDNIQ